MKLEEKKKLIEEWQSNLPVKYLVEFERLKRDYPKTIKFVEEVEAELGKTFNFQSGDWE